MEIQKKQAGVWKEPHSCFSLRNQLAEPQSLTTSPPARVPIACQFAREIPLEMKRTEPSNMRPFTPPEWKLRAVTAA